LVFFSTKREKNLHIFILNNIKDTFEDVFDSEHLKNTTWFFLLGKFFFEKKRHTNTFYITLKQLKKGNHDHFGNASAQVAYTNKSKRWILPSFNYTIDVMIDNGKTHLMSILMIDTVLLCGKLAEKDEDQPRFANKKEQMFAKLYLNSIEEQIKRLNDTDAKYLIVSGHHPVWSVGQIGPVQCVNEKLRPLLHKYDISIYFAGHEHDLQHISDTYMNRTVEYFVSGASCYNKNSTAHINDVPPGSLRYYWSAETELFVGGFALVKANKNNMTVTFIESNGKELYSTTVRPRLAAASGNHYRQKINKK
jgi:tartrate-resistant acid phosphatase type 5